MSVATMRTLALLLASIVCLQTDRAAADVGFRGHIVHFVDDPFRLEAEGACRGLECDALATESFVDGLLVVDDKDVVVAVGDYTTIRQDHVLLSVVAAPDGHLIMPGFIDCHAHAPQIDMIASYGDDLASWLLEYTFVNEAKYIDPMFAVESARRFFNQLLRSGTTSALVFNAMFEQAADAVLSEAQRRNMRIISGLTGMAGCSHFVNFTTNNDPDTVRPMCNSMQFDDEMGEISAQVIDKQVRRLLKKFHGKSRLLYSLIPRFLTTSTPASLEIWRSLKQEFPGVRFHTHLAENLVVSVNSVKAFKHQAKKFYGANSIEYKTLRTLATQTEIWNWYGLTGYGSSFAHGIHLTFRDYDILRESQSSICHCPTSNLFLDSGLFNFGLALTHNLSVGVGSDVGAGTSFEQLSTLGEVYKVAMASVDEYSNDPGLSPGRPFNGDPNSPKKYFIPPKTSFHIAPLRQLYLITLGNAKQLRMDQWIGNFSPGKEADFVIVDLAPSPLLRRRLDVIRKQKSDEIKFLSDSLFGITTVSHDRTVYQTYVAGSLVYDRECHYHNDLGSEYALCETSSVEIVTA